MYRPSGGETVCSHPFPLLWGAHSHGHADTWVRLPVWAVLLVFYSNHRQKNAPLGATGQTGRSMGSRADGQIAALINARVRNESASE